MGKAKNVLWLFLAALIAVRFLTLLSIPLFWDEALYLNLADEIVTRHGSLLNSLSVSEFPITIWILSLFRVLMPSVNPLLLGRALMTFFDVFTAIVILRIGKAVKDERAGLVSSVVYLSLPLTLFHGRVVMMESLLTLFVALAIFFGLVHILSAGTAKYGNLFAMATCMVLSFFTKPLSVVSFTPLFLIPAFFWMKKDKGPGLNKRVFSFLAATLTACLIIALIFLPFMRIFSVYLNQGDISGSLLQNFKSNLHKIAWWSEAYLTLPIIVITGAGCLLGWLRNIPFLKWLSLWILSVIVLDSLFAARMFPRHIFPLALPVALIAGFIVSRIFSRSLLFMMGILIVLYAPLKKDVAILFFPETSVLALEDRQTFYEDWTSGVGIPEVGQFLRDHGYFIAFAGRDPLIQWALQYNYGVKNGKFLKIDDRLDENEIKSEAKKNNCSVNTCYLILNKYRDAPFLVDLKKVFSNQRFPGSLIEIYKL